MLALILLLAFSTNLIIVRPSLAQTSISTPYIPEFKVTYVTSTYTVTSTNPDTGAIVANTFANDTVQIAILNQSFNPLVNGSIVGLFYNVQEEGHFSSNNWYAISSYFPATNSEYTNIGYGVTIYDGSNPVWPQVAASGQVDFQVQAFIGVGTNERLPWSEAGGYPSYYTQYTGETSAWSNAQTITIANGSTSTSIATNPPYPTFSPTLIPTSNSTLPASFPTTSPNPTVSAQSPAAGVQTRTGGKFGWTQIALFMTIAVIAALVIVVVVFVRRSKGKKEN